MERGKRDICRYAEYSDRIKFYRCNQAELAVNICPYKERGLQNRGYRCTNPEITRKQDERK